MILRFEVELGYKGPRDAFILSKNLSSVVKDPSIIDNKLKEDFRLQQVIPVPNPKSSFISSPLGLVPKYDGGFRQIHHPSHPKGRSVNDHIPDKVGELR